MSDGEHFSCDLATCVDVAHRRLGRLAMRDAALRYLGLTLLAAGVGAMARPLLWPVRDGSPFTALTFAACLAAGGLLLALAFVVVRAWRNRPNVLAAARRLDAELGLAEVVASGFSFERDRRTDEMAVFAVARAQRAVADIDIRRLLAPSHRPRSPRERKWLVFGSAALAVGLAVGAIDRNVVDRVLHPPTTREVLAAAALKRAIEMTANPAETLSPEQKAAAERVVDAARRASKAAARGDRRGARDALDDMRQASRAFEDLGRQQASSLRSLRDALEAKADGRAGDGEAEGRPSASASEALAKLKEELGRASDKESARNMLERLERAAASAASGAEPRGRGTSSETSTAWSRVAAALKEAHEAAARGDAEAAKRALERAERTVSEMEKASQAASSGMLAQMSEEASKLDRSMRAAMRGAPKAGEGEGEGEGEAPRGSDPSGAGRAKATASKGDPSGAPGAGPGAGDRTPGAEARRVNVEGSLRARADVRTGERAMSAIQGVGRGGDPKAYAEIFPAYDTVVEDGLREDKVPAARRAAVRRYFTSIRPGADTDESKE